MKQFICLLATLVLAFGAIVPEKLNEAQERNARYGKLDNFVDHILSKLRSYIKEEKLDPLTLPNRLYKFERKVLFETLTGEAGFYNGSLSGLSRIQRSTPTKASYVDKLLTLESGLVVENPVAKYDGRVTFMSIGPKINVTIRAKKFQFNLTLKQEVVGDAYPVIQDLKITNVTSLDVKIQSEYKFLSSILTRLTDFLTKFFKSEIYSVVERSIRIHLQAILKKHRLPLGDL